MPLPIEARARSISSLVGVNSSRVPGSPSRRDGRGVPPNVGVGASVGAVVGAGVGAAVMPVPQAASNKIAIVVNVSNRHLAIGCSSDDKRLEIGPPNL